MGEDGSVKNQELPVHVGIIMDGNGRWAKKRGFPRSFGHREGAKTFRRVVDYACKKGISYITFYALSTENYLKRPKEEIDSIMELLRSYLKEAFDPKNKPLHTLFIGDKSLLTPDIRQMMEEIEEKTKDLPGITVNVAVNYGGKQELVRAFKDMYHDLLGRRLSENELSEDTVSSYLYTAGQPDVDLIIRPSGEYRTSNFLIWQAAYAELVFMDNVLWPDFSPRHFDMALEEYAKRNRRYGGV